MAINQTSITKSTYLKQWEKRYKNPLYESRSENIRTRTMFADYLTSLAVNQFEVEGLPKEVEKHKWYVQNMTVINGCMGLFKDSDTGKFIMLPASPSGSLNLYGEYNSYILHGANGNTFTLNSDEVAILWDDYTHSYKTINTIMNYSNRISDLLRTADVRLNLHKQPITGSGTKEQLKSLYNIYSAISGNVPFIPVSDEDFDKLKIETKDVTYIINEINDTMQRYIKDFCQLIGINTNPETNKKERQITDEVNANNELIKISRESRFKSRKAFEKECKEKFGLNIKYKYVGGEDDVISKANSSTSDAGLRPGE